MKALWFGPFVGLALSSGAAAQEKKPVPLYTNDDLDRLSPYRGQTGVLSEPAVGATETPTTPNGARGEAYWRREAARVRAEVRALEERAEEIRGELREARNAPPSPWSWSSRPRRVATPALASREARLHALERRVRELETDLADRARRAGALPGWLR